MQSFRRAAVTIALLPGIAGTLGCYAYYPARESPVLQGQRISLTLTDSGSVVLAPKIGPSVLAIARPLVASVEHREFSAPRSVFAGTLAAIGVAALTSALRGKGDNGSLGSGTGAKPTPQ
jgi:hypothetical protein